MPLIKKLIMNFVIVYLLKNNNIYSTMKFTKNLRKKNKNNLRSLLLNEWLFYNLNYNLNLYVFLNLNFD